MLNALCEFGAVICNSVIGNPMFEAPIKSK